MAGIAFHRIGGWLVLGLVLGPMAARPDDRPFRLFWSEGEPCVGLESWGRVTDLRFRQENGGGLVLSDGLRTLRFEPDGQRCSLLGVEAWLSAPVRKAGRTWALNRADAAGMVDPILRPYRALAGRRARMVMLDPGHGGNDGGGLGPGGVREKDLVLDLARRVQARLHDSPFEIGLTREKDETVALEERTQRAARRNADLFISLHLNIGDDPTAEGIETYVLTKAGFTSTNTRGKGENGNGNGNGNGHGAGPDPGNRYDAPSAVLGWQLQRQFVRQGLAVDRGLRQARFLVLRSAPCPAALVECGFMSNPAEGARLGDEAHRERLAAAMAQGILDYAQDVRMARFFRFP